jgi:gamma-glutamyl:cysteine ligase YbdK (ATP-grasp superfamily)
LSDPRHWITLWQKQGFQGHIRVHHRHRRGISSCRPRNRRIRQDAAYASGRLRRLRRQKQLWRHYDNSLIAENRWRAQRYGTTGGLIDFGRQAIDPFADLLEEMIAIVREDAEALGCPAEVEVARNILKTGTSAKRQRKLAAEIAASGG